ncbi:hypothetical protein [Amycolatopsis sp. NPDC051903]
MGETTMPHVIAEPCGDVTDGSWLEECPVDRSHESERKLYRNPLG